MIVYRKGPVLPEEIIYVIDTLLVVVFESAVPVKCREITIPNDAFFT
ncbi:hypothetical protein V473_06325 [Sphingobium cupriresistens LL01]|uniref:Uncharacterized protein n=1 Tax=Sphingobium cupriresistens LL01 TaxID=1420583 RepID=A0A0J8AX46_9SPHN|nr:hypothetical protein V473_06325 [Sphingobium cupriresistens LL01]